MNFPHQQCILGFHSIPSQFAKSNLVGRPPVRCCGLWKPQPVQVKTNLEPFFQFRVKGNFSFLLAFAESRCALQSLGRACWTCDNTTGV
jgi:hypothetical protein